MSNGYGVARAVAVMVLVVIVATPKPPAKGAHWAYPFERVLPRTMESATADLGSAYLHGGSTWS